MPLGILIICYLNTEVIEYSGRQTKNQQRLYIKLIVLAIELIVKEKQT